MTEASKLALFFAPLDGGSTLYTVTPENWASLVEQYGLDSGSKYPFLSDVWDVDAEAYFVLGSSKAALRCMAMERWEQSMRARYDDALQWNTDIAVKSWDEYWQPFYTAGYAELAVALAD
jgi:hypothetical protein